MIILGVTHPISWNNAAALLVDGQLVAMVEEERLNRIKHAPRMAPRMAIDYCLKTVGITLKDVDYVAIGFDRAAKAGLGNLANESLLSGLNQAARWFIDGLEYEKQLPFEGFPDDRVIFVNHHMAHAASTFYPSGFDEANVISLDGSGGSDAGLLGVGRGANIEVLKRVSNTGSWGLLYEEITDKLGFRRHSGEGKVMGLAAYGKPDPAGFPFIKWDVDIPEIDGKGRKAFIASLPTRHKDDELTEYHSNLAATLQDVLERAGAQMVEWLYQQTGLRRLCLAGGTALNCSMNGKLAQLPFVDEIYVQPAAHDAGTALGAALHVQVEKTGQRPNWQMQHAYWGPEYTNEEIEQALKAFETSVEYHRSGDVFLEAAQFLQQGKVVGWFQGRSEVGPRALGNRSILGHPGLPEMKDTINMKVKHREPWRPFAPSILEAEIDRYVSGYNYSPFMILAFETRAEHQAEIVSATHIDATCRPQTVSKATNPRYWQVINRFYELTGIPAVLNTSFNVDSQPIVNTPTEGIDTFLNCGMDVLAIGDFIAFKK